MSHLDETLSMEPFGRVVAPKSADAGLIVAAEGAHEAPAGSTTAVHVSSDSHLVAWSEPNSLGAEKFRALVTRLDHLRRQEPLRSLQITSSVVSEGKTLVAANLAITLGKYSGAKTLLLEGNLHRPTLAPLFGLTGLQGITDWWSGADQDLSHFLYRFDNLPLWLLPAGKAYEQPSQILRSSRFAAAFARLTASFDWTIVDSTAMSPIIDANLWSHLVNGTLLVVREGVAPVKALKRGLQSLDYPKLLGVVINEAAQPDQRSYEGQYYGLVKTIGK